MTQKELIKQISTTTGVSVADVNKVIKAFTESVKESLARGEKVKMQKFGTFSTEKRASRVAVLKGKSYNIPERRVPVIVFSDEVKELCAKNSKN